MGQKGNLLYEKKWKDNVYKLAQENPRFYLSGFVNFNINLAYKTLNNYLLYLIRFCKGLNKRVEKVNFDDFTAYLNSLRDSTPSNQVVAYSALKKFSKYLFVSGKTKTDFMLSIERPNATERQTTIDKRQKGFLTQDEISFYLKNINESTGYKEAKMWKDRDLFLIMLFLNTGLRCSGIWKLDLDDIDVQNCTLTTTEKRGKVRTYPLNNTIITLYNNWIEKRKIRAALGEVALFVSENGHRLSTKRMIEIIHSYAHDINGKNITPHKLRATFGTQVYNATGDIYLTQVAMGHSTPKTTELYIRGADNKNMNIASDVMAKLTS